MALISTCRGCGCTDQNACIGPAGVPCHWIANGVCSECKRLAPLVVVTHGTTNGERPRELIVTRAPLDRRFAQATFPNTRAGAALVGAMLRADA